MKVEEYSINNYTKELIIDNHRIVLTDTEIRNKKEQKIKSISNILIFTSIVVGIMSFIWCIGILGHCDYLIALDLYDDWISINYVFNIVVTVFGVVISFILFKISRFLNKLIEDLYYEDITSSMIHDI